MDRQNLNNNTPVYFTFVSMKRNNPYRGFKATLIEKQYRFKQNRGTL